MPISEPRGETRFLSAGPPPKRMSSNEWSTSRYGFFVRYSRTRDSRLTMLVSCVMPTRDRRPLLPFAIKQFLRQDYADCELVVLDDSQTSVEDLVPPDGQIRYFRNPGGMTLGDKRNLACELSRGEVILHWDDDD
jgi:hypothetical protein